MSIELTKQMAEDFFKMCVERAKEEIDEGGITPKTIILADNMEIGEFLRKRSYNVETWEPVKDDGSEPNALVIMFIINTTNADALVDMLKFISDDPKTAEEMIDRLRVVGQALTPPGQNVNERIITIFKNIYRWHEKDILAAYLKKVCQRTKAHAFVKLDEVWTPGHNLTKEELEKFRGSLEKSPDSLEALSVYLETKTMQRLYVQPFYREVRNKGKPYKWGEPKDATFDEQTKDAHYGGRFTHFIKPLPPDMPDLIKKYTPHAG